MDIAVNYKVLGGVKGDRKRKEIGSVGLSLFNFCFSFKVKTATPKYYYMIIVYFLQKLFSEC